MRNPQLKEKWNERLFVKCTNSNFLTRIFISLSICKYYFSLNKKIPRSIDPIIPLSVCFSISSDNESSIVSLLLASYFFHRKSFRLDNVWYVIVRWLKCSNPLSQISSLFRRPGHVVSHSPSGLFPIQLYVILMSTKLVLRCYLVTPYNWVFLEGNNAKEIVSANSLEYRLKDICGYERVQHRIWIYRLIFFERGNDERLNVIIKWIYFLYNKFIYLVLLEKFIFWKFLKTFSISDNKFLFYVYYAIKEKVCGIIAFCW